MTPEQRQAIAIAQARVRMAQEGSQEALETLREPATPGRAPLREHAMNGFNQDLAATLGFPVDAVSAVISGVVGRPNIETEIGDNGLEQITGIGEQNSIQSPIGGSESIERVMRSLGAVTDAQPKSAAERYAHSIGGAGGAMAVPGLWLAARSRQLGRTLGLEGASAVGEGIGSQVAEDVFPDSPLAQIAGALAGGSTPIGLHRMARPSPSGPSIQDKLDEASDAYGRVDAATDTINPNSRQALVDRLQSRMSAEDMDAELHPRATRSTALFDERLPDNPTIADVERRRRGVSRNVAGAPDREEARLGQILKEETDAYLDNLSPNDMSGGDPQSVIGDLHTGRDATARARRAQLIEDAALRGERRAGTSGGGGNRVNAIRQNIRSILDNPSKRRGFTDGEIEAMEEVVMGTRTTNAMRNVGKLSPTSGLLPTINAISAPAVLGPLAAIPPVAGIAAKGMAENLTQRQIDRISELILNGAPLDPKRMSDAERRVVSALLAAQAPNAVDQAQSGQ